jgi:hypothetical protein
MKKITYKSFLFFLIYALALNPVSIVLADNIDSWLSNSPTAHCKQEGKVHKDAMQMADSASSMQIADQSGCKCSQDCGPGACGQQCNDCGHIFAGFPAISLEFSNTHPELINITPVLLHQQTMLVHYRPPKTLHS